MPQDTLKRAAAAEILGIAPGTLRFYANTGQLHPLRTRGGHRRFKREDVLALAERRTTRLRARLRAAKRAQRKAAAA